MTETQIIKKRQEILEKKVQEVQNELSGISLSNGMLAEELFYNLLDSQNSFFGFEIDSVLRNVSKHIKSIDLKEEFDIILECNEVIFIIETKYRARSKDFNLLNRKVNNYQVLFESNKSIIPVLAALSFEKEIKKAARNNDVKLITILNDQLLEIM